MSQTERTSFKTSADFYCDASFVWGALTDVSGYGDWYGYPERVVPAACLPELAPGTKLELNSGGHTSVITVFEPQTRLEISAGSRRDGFFIEPQDFGCRVFMSCEEQNDRDRNKEDIRERAEHILQQLKDKAYEKLDDEKEPERPRLIKKPGSRRVGDIISDVLLGYKTPIEPRRTPVEESVELSSMIDNTEGDVVIHLRALMTGVIFALVFFTVLAVAVRFERSDIVPSSGLSVVESVDVTKENAWGLYIGQSKNELETAINCQGIRLSTNEYVYYYVKPEEGDVPYRIYVNYDAYSKVRRFGYVDMYQSDRPLNGDIWNVGTMFAGDTPIEEAESLVGVPMSAFWTDKSGVTTVYFGRYDTRNELFNSDATSELVVKLDNSKMTVSAQYYQGYSESNPLPTTEITKKLRNQYTNLQNYLADRAAYERIFLLLGKKREQTELVLEARTVDYAPTYNSGIVGYYASRSPVAEDRGNRYLYTATYYFDNLTAEITLENRYAALIENSMYGEDEYRIQNGMMLFELYSELGILPTYASCSYDKLILCYGQRVSDTEDPMKAYQFSAELEMGGLTVTDFSFN